MNTWLNGEPFEVSETTLTSFRRVKKRFGCSLCGHEFKAGERARWIYANSTPGQCTGNFFVCFKCDGLTTDVLERAKQSLETTVKMARAWGIYGPDWQEQSNAIDRAEYQDGRKGEP